MHLTILIGSFLIDSVWSLVLFGLLKTGADLIMHLIEHAQLAKRALPVGIG